MRRQNVSDPPVRRLESPGSSMVSPNYPTTHSNDYHRRNEESFRRCYGEPLSKLYSPEANPGAMIPVVNLIDTATNNQAQGL
jgi:hypothetical protein